MALGVAVPPPPPPWWVCPACGVTTRGVAGDRPPPRHCSWGLCWGWGGAVAGVAIGGHGGCSGHGDGSGCVGGSGRGGGICGGSGGPWRCPRWRRWSRWQWWPMAVAAVAAVARGGPWWPRWPGSGRGEVLSYTRLWLRTVSASQNLVPGAREHRSDGMGTGTGTLTGTGTPPSSHRPAPITLPGVLLLQAPSCCPPGSGVPAHPAPAGPGCPCPRDGGGSR